MRANGWQTGAVLLYCPHTTGAVTVLGPITGPERLRQIGMHGFAIGPAPCPSPDGGPGTTPATLPVGHPIALLLLGLFLAGFGLRRLRVR